MPPDLQEKVMEARDLLKSIERRLLAVEAGQKQDQQLFQDLRHDFHNAQQVLSVLMTEIEQRHPFGKK